jgi:hypothetical protein
VDICSYITPDIIYRLLGDDAAIAAGLPLWQIKASPDIDPNTPIDLSWAEELDNET